ncbi:unnamed protein product [Pleuronectes platessa]|uniref:Uncharacterized protein n=1 Tax=Pleuronectes platessa TaxID=8262 RepID=A0A9N7VQR8_PLEPL|nr:unnamed protein product [Pleuronectes platessa]
MTVKHLLGPCGVWGTGALLGAQSSLLGAQSWGAKEMQWSGHTSGPSSFSLKGKNAGKIHRNSTRNQKFPTSPAHFWGFGRSTPPKVVEARKWYHRCAIPTCQNKCPLPLSTTFTKKVIKNISSAFRPFRYFDPFRRS